MSAENRVSDEAIQQQVEEIIAAGALGKSDAYVRLLRFLADRAHTNKSVKEIEIAIEVFGRDETFDVTQDSLVRVYIHKLRTKLDKFYSETKRDYPQRLSIPKGSYLLGLETNDESSNAIPRLVRIANRERLLLVGISLFVGACLSLGWLAYRNSSAAAELALNSDIWHPLANVERPLLVVIGDVFVFSEVTPQFEQLREVRDFSIASAEDFQRRQEFDQSFLENYRDFGVRYMPQAIAPSLRSLSRFLGPEKSWHVQLASQVSATDLESADIIYIGYFTSLGIFKDLIFDQSALELHPNGNVLIQSDTGDVFVGDGQVAEGYRDRYLDHAMLSKTGMANGNSLIALMSARDAGLEYLADFAFSAVGTAAIEAGLSSGLETGEPDFEMLLEVSGNDPDNLISQIRMIQQVAE